MYMNQKQVSFEMASSRERSANSHHEDLSLTYWSIRRPCVFRHNFRSEVILSLQLVLCSWIEGCPADHFAPRSAKRRGEGIARMARR